MKTIRLNYSALQRRPALLAELLPAAVMDGSVLEVSRELYLSLRHLKTQSRPVKDWPAWALIVALFAAPEDCGVGDTLLRELGDGERFKRHHEAIFGVWKKPCACTGKARQWNKLYSYTEPANN